MTIEINSTNSGQELAKGNPSPKEMRYDTFQAMVAFGRNGHRFVDRYEVGDVITLYTSDGGVFKKKVVQEKFFQDVT